MKIDGFELYLLFLLITNLYKRHLIDAHVTNKSKTITSPQIDFPIEIYPALNNGKDLQWQFFSPLAYSSQFIQAHDNKDMTVIAKYYRFLE